MKSSQKLIPMVIILLMGVVKVNAQDWPQYLGPTRNSVSQQKGILRSWPKHGRIMWKTKRSPDFNKGSMILADGLILATDGAKSLYLIEPNPSEFKPIASAELLALDVGDEQMAARFATQNWAPLALADGKLLIRDQNRLMCVRVTQ